MVTMFCSIECGNIIAQTSQPVLSDGNIHYIITPRGCVFKLRALRLDNMPQLSRGDCEKCGIYIL